MHTNEKLVVFDFDDTIYARSQYGSPVSCYLDECPMFQLSDRSFLERVIKGLVAANVDVGVASFGKKSIIIECMNNLLYSNGNKLSDGTEPYFGQHNVITVPDVREYWKKELSNMVSYQKYLEKYKNNEDSAFNAFIEIEKPEQNAKYFCRKLPPEAKVVMIDIIRKYYEQKNKTEIPNNQIRFFDDDPENIRIALKKGILAHQVPSTGFTEKWWRTQTL